jgi:hypothetical protein
MAMTTYVQMVTEAEIAELRKSPKSINQLDKPSAETFRTHYEGCINYFLTGTAYPDDHALASMLSGTDHVATPTLENGGFGVSSAAQVAAIAKELAKVDVKAIRKAVGSADFDDLMDEEVEDAEILQQSDDPTKVLGDEIDELVRFYAKAAEKNLGVAAYTS